MNTNIQDTNNGENKIKNYKKILNNLLSVSYNDSCLFSNIDNEKWFDFLKKFGDESFDKIIKNNKFSISLETFDDKKIEQELEKVENIEEVEEILKEYEKELPKNLWTKKDSIEEVKTKIIKLFKDKKQKNAFKWKMILNEANKLNEQNNLWPLHLGFLYITVKIDNKIIQAPLFFKDITIDIENSKISLVSLDSLRINEKLIYLLESNNYLFDLDFDYSQMSIEKLFEIVSKSWSQNFEIIPSLKGNVPNFSQEKIQNEGIKFWPGISLGFFEPTGGHLRKTMIKIIKEDLLDDILSVEFDKNIYKNTINTVMVKKNFGFFKIVDSNLSQDKAVISALNQHTIIWGPPGTGKSQTITNILVNVLMFQKTAIVVSQKKAALEVLKNRMKSLEIFCLFILNSKSMKKSDFYNPIKNYVNYLENFNENANELSIKIINDDEKSMMKLINSIMIKKNVEDNIILYSSFVEKNPFNLGVFDQIKKLDKNIKYDFDNLKKQKPRKIGSFLMKINNIKRPNIFIWETKDIKKTKEIIKKDFLNLDLNLDYFVSKNDVIDLNLLHSINKLNNIQLAKTNSINDDKLLKIMIAKNIVNKIKDFDNILKKKYSEFALDVRVGSLDPIVFIKKHADILKIIYPIIITTPETNLQSWERNEFDYALLDESSQILLEKGLPIFYLSKIKILAGDDQQMQPTKWFATKSEASDNSYENIESLLDYAIAKGVHKILLNKNYRSNSAALMKFNSEVFYEGKLSVIDKKTFTNSKNASIEVINANGVWEDSKNIKELELMIEKLKENFDNYEKIILLCFNASQQTALETMIFESYPEYEKAMSTNKLLIRNIENIQGDEADLLIVSVAYDKNTKLYSTYVAKPGGKNALNVATSRARDKIIVIKSIYSNEIINSNSLEDIDVFKEWLNFLDLSEEEQKNYIYYKNEVNKDKNKPINEEEKSTNEFKKALISKIENDLSEFKEDFKFELNYSIGSIKIPFAILDKSSSKYVAGIYIDTFSYFHSYSDYVNDKDVINFFKSKNYLIYRISFLNWSEKKEVIISEIRKYIQNKLNNGE